ncbi:hypothetical protein N8089_03740 [Flavobacteriales bacterium]|nr:hypothetical protein [Flavobacteriales bacterium]
MRYINKQRFVKANQSNNEQIPGTDGVDGQDGKSAYQIWLDLGNVGTEADFVNSLTGPQGIQGQAGNDGADGINGIDGQDGVSAYETWLSLGNEGTEQDFISSITGQQGAAGTNGVDGQDGKSAYQIWLDLGNTGTEEDFINSLTGPQGMQGQAGNDGVDGIDGLDGQDGKSAYQIWLDLGNGGTEEDFINSLKGQDGTTGTGSGDIQLTNRSSQVLEPGDIVILDKNNPLSVTTTNLYYSPDVIGVVKTGGGIGQLVTVQTSGIVDVKMTVLPVNIGDNIYTGDVYGRGYASATAWPNIFAKALTSKSNGVLGTVQALLLLA